MSTVCSIAWLHLALLGANSTRKLELGQNPSTPVKIMEMYEFFGKIDQNIIHSSIFDKNLLDLCWKIVILAKKGKIDTNCARQNGIKFESKLRAFPTADPRLGFSLDFGPIPVYMQHWSSKNGPSTSRLAF